MKTLSPIKQLQQRVDSLIVQLDLGKLEASVRVEEQMDRLRASIDHLGHPASDPTVVALKRYLDELLIQARLGKMETAAACLRERETLEAKITDARRRLEQIEHSAVEEFAEAAHALSQKMTLLALNLGAAGVLAQESLVGTKATVKERLANLSGTLQAKGELAGEKAHQAAEESREALEGILSNLRSLVGK